MACRFFCVMIRMSSSRSPPCKQDSSPVSLRRVRFMGSVRVRRVILISVKAVVRILPGMRYSIIAEPSRRLRPASNATPSCGMPCETLTTEGFASAWAN